MGIYPSNSPTWVGPGWLCASLGPLLLSPHYLFLHALLDLRLLAADFSLSVMHGTVPRGLLALCTYLQTVPLISPSRISGHEWA